MNEQNNTSDRAIRDGEKEYSTLSATPERRPVKKKKSLYKSQKLSAIILIVVIALLVGGVIAATVFLNKGDGIIDTFTEKRGENSYSYYSREDTENGGFKITDKNGETLELFYVDENGNPVDKDAEGAVPVYETELGSLLSLASSGKIVCAYKVDFGGAYDVEKTGFRVLMHKHIDRNDIKTIKIHHKNKDGSVTEFTVKGVDGASSTDAAGNVVENLNEYFQIEGYELATVNNLAVEVLCSYVGFPYAQNKLSIGFMKDYDRLQAEREGYLPLVNADGSIRFSEYGLDEENAAYYEVTVRSGEVYRIYIGSKAPNGTGYYVRFSDMSADADASDKNRNAVYRVADDPTSSALGVDVSRTKLFLGGPEELVYPQIVYPSTMATYLMAENFKTYRLDPESARADAEGYRKIIDISYEDLEVRNYTMTQTQPYLLNDTTLLGGYSLNGDKISDALQKIYDVSSIIGNDYNQIAVKNYVTIRELVKNVIPVGIARPNPGEFSSAETYRNAFVEYGNKLDAAVAKAVKDDAELFALLDQYGLAKPAYKFSYNTTQYYASNLRLPLEYNLVWASALTKNNTYYLWAPKYQQILEVGYQYFSMLNMDSFDWVTDDVYDISIHYCDSIRVTGKDNEGKKQDILYELDNSFKLTWTNGFSTTYTAPFDSMITSSSLNVTAGIDYNGKRTLSVKSAIKYALDAINSETGEKTQKTMTLSPELVSVDLDTVKAYCQMIASPDRNEFLANLSEEMRASIETYASSKPQAAINGTTVAVVHRVSDAAEIKNGNHYLEAKIYRIVFKYNTITKMISVEIGHEGEMAATVFEERVFNNYVLMKLKNSGEGEAEKLANLTEAEKNRVEELYRTVTGQTTSQDRLRVTIFDENGNAVSSEEYLYSEKDENSEGSLHVRAFKKFYQTMLYSSYAGYANVAETVGGAKLGDSEMAAYKSQGDDCDLKIDVKLGMDGLRYIYRMYNYSSAKTYVTVQAKDMAEGEGMFYILRTRTDKFLSDAVKASNGDINISGDETY